MAGSRWTDELAPDLLHNVSSEVRSAIAQLEAAFPKKTQGLYRWKDCHSVVALDVDVDLPSRGTVGGIDIRDTEPILLIFHEHRYPFEAPLILSDRRDFPSDRLPHLQPAADEEMACLCLHRGSINDWFLEHSVVQLVERARAWLRDAARGRLMREDDGFEPTRIITPVGTSIYQSEALLQTARSWWHSNGGAAGYQYVIYDILVNNASIERFNVSLRICGSLEEMTSRELRSWINRVAKPCFGVVTWPPQQNVCEQYFGRHIKTLGNLLHLGKELEVLLDKAMNKFLRFPESKIQRFLPVTMIVPRPRCVIGREDNFEFLNYVILDSEPSATSQRFGSASSVAFLGHREPLTTSLARDISWTSDNRDLGRILMIGCGAVGSKVAIHFARSGNLDLTLVDQADLSPHNLVRHALLPESVGKRKAEALQEVIVGLFEQNDPVPTRAVVADVLEVLFGSHEHLLGEHSWLLDTTGSNTVLTAISWADIPDTLRCSRGEIADHGHLGFFLCEGPGRNPRLDDLQALLFDSARKDAALSKWLRNHREDLMRGEDAALDEIRIGVSCSSSTMRLPDELVSQHAASFATGFRKVAQDDPTNPSGHIQVGKFHPEETVSMTVQHFRVKPFTIIRALGDREWEVRFKNGLDILLNKLLVESSPNETGGLLIGTFDLKQKTIHVTDVLDAPPDSKRSPFAFERGVQDVPQVITDIYTKTGGMISYVGEWHTHPNGSSVLSDQDSRTVAGIKRHLDQLGIPTHILIITTQGLCPHVFAP